MAVSAVCLLVAACAGAAVGAAAAVGPDPEPAVTPTVAAPATQAPTPTGAPRSWGLDNAFLGPAGASEVEAPGWSVSGVPVRPGALVAPCGEAAAPLSGRVLEEGERTLASQREAGGSLLRQEVYRYATAASSSAAFETYAERLDSCQSTQVEEVGSRTNEVVDREADGLLVRRRACAARCDDLSTEWQVVVRVDEALTTASYAVVEDGDPEDGARALAAALRRQLETTVRG